jgi:glycosyltransferase involved in cell wall biosynthesis
MAARDAEATIADAVESIVGQTLREWELIVVDDGSRDRTGDVAAGLARKDDRIKTLRTSGLGPAAARNVGLEVAGGQYVAILDADDLAVANRLERQVGYLRDHPEVAAAGSAALHFVSKGTAAGRFPPGPTSESELRLWRNQGRLIAWCHSSVMWRAAAIRSLGGFDQQFAQAEDSELINRAVYNHGLLVLGLREALVWFRLSPAGLSTAGIREQRMAARYLELRNRCWLNGNPPPSFDQYLTEPFGRRQRMRWARHDSAAQLYRDAGYKLAVGNRTAAAWRVAVAATLHPRYVLPKVWRQKIQPAFEKAKRWNGASL